MANWFNRLFFWLFSSLFFITPLIMFHKTAELFEFNKMIFIYLLTAIIASLWITKMILYKYKKIITQSGIRSILKKTVFDIPILLFLVSQIASTIFSIDRHTSFYGYYGRFNGGLLSVIAYIILYWAFVSNINGKDAARRVFLLLKISLIASVVVIFWGLPGKLGFDLTCLIFTGNFDNSCWTEQFKPQERMFSTLGQPNWLGAYLAINFFIGLYFFIRPLVIPTRQLASGGEESFFKGILRFAQDDKKSLFYFLYLLVNFSALLFTRSRSALAAVVFGLVVFFLFILLRQKQSIKKMVYLVVFLLIPIFIFKTGITKIDRILGLKFQIPNTKQINLSGNITDSLDIRKIVWRGAIDLGLKYPLFGTGVETFAYSYYFVRPAAHNLTSEWDFLYNKAHNEYLNYLATTGFFGVGSYILMISFVVFLSFRPANWQVAGRNLVPPKTGRKNVEENLPFYSDRIKVVNLTICLFLSYLSILITNFFGFSTTTINLYFYLIPAFLIVLSQNPTSNFQPPTSIRLTLSQKFLLSFPLLTLIFGLLFVVNYFLADVNYALGDGYQKSQDYTSAYQYFTKALSHRREHVYEDKLSHAAANLSFIAAYQVFSGSSKPDVSDKEKKEQADQLYQLAEYYNLVSIKSSPKNVLYWKTRAKNEYLFYQIYQEEKFFNEAVEALERARDLSPTDPKIYYNLALFYLLQLENNKNIDKVSLSDRLLKAVDQSIELKSDFRDGYYTKGIILKKLGRKEEAKETLQYILNKINPSDEEVKKEIQSL